MANYEFKAPEYDAEGNLNLATFVYDGDSETGWILSRNEREFLRLGPGFEALPNRQCGVCSTDLSRKHLPFPLPQVIGHEVIASSDQGSVAVEINATHHSLGLEKSDCPWCRIGWDTHCPQRLTLGIDRLPGGFAPWILAPSAGTYKVPKEVGQAAILTEPFAATLRALSVTRPRPGDRVAVLGPRRLGGLLLVALACFRRQQGFQFEITALTRHNNICKTALALGADVAINTRTQGFPEKESFDLVYDTTGNPQALQTALELAKRAVHLKSTHGLEVMGLSHLTEMVIAEQAILPATRDSLSFTWYGEEQRDNRNILVSPRVDQAILEELRGGSHRFHVMTIAEACERIEGDSTFLDDSPLPRFDLALVASLSEVDEVINGIGGNSPLRAGGAILLVGDCESPLAKSVRDRGLALHTSRCGYFQPALDLLAANPDLARVMADTMITHRLPLEDITSAFQIAADSTQSIKVVVETQAP